MKNKSNISIPFPEAPYRGIWAFRFVDQQVFFAREKEVQKLIRLITIYRNVLLFGSSGTGKSSLINAGLIPTAISEDFTPERIRVQPLDNEEIVIERIPSVLSNGKPTFLPSNLVEDENPDECVVLSLNTFKQKLHQAKEKNERPLLIFDQFEEFITLFEEAPQGKNLKSAQEIQKKIIDVLAELFHDHSLPVKLLFVFREDYLAKLSKLFEKDPNLLEQQVHLKPLKKSILEKIIQGPFEKPELKQHFEKEFDEELIKNIIQEIEEKSEGDNLNLSEIQIVCYKLWESNEPDILLNNRRLEGLLEDYFEEALKQISDNLHDRDIAIVMLGRMVTTSGLRNVVSKDDLIGSVQRERMVDSKQVEHVLRGLEENAKLICRGLRRNLVYYEIVSEFLIPWILKKKAELKAEIDRRKVEVEERFKRKKIRWAAFWAIMLVILVSGVFVYINREKAAVDLKVRMANSERDEAIEARKQAENERDDALSRMNLALTEKRAAIQVKRNAIIAKNVAIKAKEQSENDRDDAIHKMEQAIKEKKAANEAKKQAESARNDAIARMNKAIREKNDAIARMDQAIIERNDAILIRDIAVDDREDAICMMEQAMTENYNMSIEKKEAEKLVKIASSEIVRLNHVIDKLRTEINIHRESKNR